MINPRCLPITDPLNFCTSRRSILVLVDDVDVCSCVPLVYIPWWFASGIVLDCVRMTSDFSAVAPNL